MIDMKMDSLLLFLLFYGCLPIVWSSQLLYPSSFVPTPEVPRHSSSMLPTSFYYSAKIKHIPSPSIHQHYGYHDRYPRLENDLNSLYSTKETVKEVLPKSFHPYDSPPSQMIPDFAAADDIPTSTSSSECALVLRRTFVKKTPGRTQNPGFYDLFKQPFNK